MLRNVVDLMNIYIYICFFTEGDTMQVTAAA